MQLAGDVTSELQFLPPSHLLDTGELSVTLPLGQVVVYGFDLAGPAAVLQHCEALLAPDEREKAARFRTEKLQQEYVFAHAALRLLLGRCLGRPAAAVQMTAGPFGKPAVEGLAFNLSHSGGRCLIALAQGLEIGVDLERHRDIEAESIARNYFFGTESEAVLGAPDVNTRFFDYWTAKEAVMKGSGAGFTLPLDRFAVSLHPEGALSPVQSMDAALLEPDWFVRRLPCSTGWSAALAARGQEWTVLTQPALTGRERLR